MESNGCVVGCLNDGSGHTACKQPVFSAYELKALYTSVTSSVVDEDGVTNYATIIVRNDNPRLVEVIAEFTSTISLLNQKP